jgi:EAL domain-containing protein (putative c-di-GMP-specific phosphodiesterase class I)
MICVNVSSRELLEPGFAEHVLQSLKATQLPPRTLILEITESVVMQDSKQVMDQMERLRRAGVRLAVDDFGTGYSSLSRLEHLPIDILKIARPFVAGLGDSADKDAFVQAIIQLGSTLHLAMIAEGIEERAQEAILRELGCEMGQGYLFAKPVSEADMTRLLDQVIFAA